MKKAMRMSAFVVAVGVLASVTAGAGFSSTAGPSSRRGLPVVGISQLVPAPALNDLVTGIKLGLAQRGFVDGKNVTIDVEDANGDISLAQAITQKFIGENVAVLVPITTPASQVAAKLVAGTNIKMVFAGVSDPVAAGIIKQFGVPTGTNITGLYNRNPIAGQMSLAQQIDPKIKRLGVIYDAGEANSVSDVARLTKIVAKKHWELVKVTVASSNDVLSAARSLVGKVDAMYMPQDNTVNAALDALIKVEDQYKLPLFTGDAQSVGNGAVATVGQNNVTAGEQAAGMIAGVLKGSDPGKIIPEPVLKHEIYVNTQAARIVALKIPKTILRKAINEAPKARG